MRIVDFIRVITGFHAPVKKPPQGEMAKTDFYEAATPALLARLGGAVTHGIIQLFTRPIEKFMLRGWAPHLEKNKQQINLLAEAFLKDWTQKASQTRPRALILGVGMGNDIDLAYLSQHFDLTLVDIRSEALEEVKKNIPSEQRGRVNTISGDVSNGVIARFLEKVLQSIDMGLALDDLIETAIKESKPELDKLWGEADFVVSSMLLSQFVLSPIETIYKHKYGDKGQYDAFDPNLMMVDNMPLARLQGSLINQHVRALRAYAKSGSWVYLASDLFDREGKNSAMRMPLLFDDTGNRIEHLSEISVVDDELAFRELGNWDWQIEPGLYHEVEAIALLPIGALSGLPIGLKS